MIFDLLDARTSVEKKISRYRSIQRIIIDTNFQRLLNLTDADEQLHVLALIEKGDLKSLRSWISEACRIQCKYMALPLSELRKLGVGRGIPDCHLMDKETIVAHLESEDANRNREKNKRTVEQHGKTY
jgi:hypothetical protein